MVTHCSSNHMINIFAKFEPTDKCHKKNFKSGFHAGELFEHITVNLLMDWNLPKIQIYCLCCIIKKILTPIQIMLTSIIVWRDLTLLFFYIDMIVCRVRYD